MNTICLDNRYSTTKLLIQDKPDIVNKSEDKFESVLFLPICEGRKGEGGLRTKGYFKKSFEKKPLISIITAVFNGEKYLEETIQTVINQTYDNVEYIIIDGGSTDGTLDIIKNYEDKINYWVSERDKGISDAFNKGLRAAKGDYINFQGDGDGFISFDSLEKVFKSINPDEDIFISARIQRVDLNAKEMFISKYIDNFDKKSLLYRMSLAHQGLFTHKNYFKKYGLFDINNIFCMDYEHLLRSYHEFPKVITKNIVVARWRDDGLGNGKILKVLNEYNKIRKDNKIANVLFLEAIHYWSIFKYFVKLILRKLI